jgi:hypothetical protein
MHRMSRGKATHSDRLERWLGKEHVESISAQFKDFYWPVPVHGVPGNVFVMPGGDFAGEIKVGQFMSKHDGAALTIQKIKKRIDAKVRRNKAMMSLADLLHTESRQHASIGAFASIDAVIAAWKAGKGQVLRFSKVGVTGSVGKVNDLWYSAGVPTAGAAAGAGTEVIPVASSNGSLGYRNLGAAGTGHYLNWSFNASVAGNSLLLYDRLYATGCSLSTAAAQARSSVPTRYQNTTAGNDSYIGGNFAYVVGAAAGAFGVSPTLQGVYTDQDGTGSNNLVGAAASNLATVAGVGLMPLGQGRWFFGLAAGDVGVKEIDQIQVDVTLNSGGADWVTGHPIAVLACPIANLACMDDGLYTSLSLTHIEDNACLSFLELPKPATTACTYAGVVRTVGE